jgi:hypothetical protein
MRAGRVSAGIITGVFRCRWGFPKVVLCAAEKRARPFPTSFWLLCPYLLRAASALESRNGVEAMQIVLEGRAEEWRRYHMLHAALRLAFMGRVRKKYLRRYARRSYESLRRGGVGGIAPRPGVTVKCLHLQIASYIGVGFHPASDLLERSIPAWECGNGECAPRKR